MSVRRASVGRIALFSLVFALISAVCVSPGRAASSRKSWERGRIFYTERCIHCHGKSGGGWGMQSRIPRPPAPVPNLTDPGFMSRFSDKDLFKVIKEGGTREGKSRFMPAAGRWLSDKDIRDVISYVRSLVRGAKR